MFHQNSVITYSYFSDPPSSFSAQSFALRWKVSTPVWLSGRWPRSLASCGTTPIQRTSSRMRKRPANWRRSTRRWGHNCTRALPAEVLARLWSVGCVRYRTLLRIAKRPRGARGRQGKPQPRQKRKRMTMMMMTKTRRKRMMMTTMMTSRRRVI